MPHNTHLTCMWGNKSDFFLIIVSKGTRGTEIPPHFLSTYLFSIKFLYYFISFS